MTMLPAICGNCGFVFSSGYELINVRMAVFKNNVTTCPRCRQMAKVPDGVYQAIGNTLKVLHDTDGSQEVIDRLLRALGEIADNPDTNVKQALTSESIPNAEKIAKTAPKDNKNKAIWAAGIGAAIAYTTKTLPEGAISWIELIEKMQSFFGSN